MRENDLTNWGVNESKVRVIGVIGAVVTVAVVTDAAFSIRIDLSRDVNLRIGSNSLTVGIHPCSAYIACVVVVHQRGVLIVGGRYMLKKRNLWD